ncbi:serine/threonine-protein kinase [Streptomyces sp. NPDC088554]|uniref:serine/threonine-protein kinase n=1 Tax=Streptomyces sp. NPDC088554 TaxID=3365865 RepID=UPI0038024434
MGRVWRAHDEVLHRTVAIKELTAGRYVSEADRAVLHRRTQKEARAAARITHPAVVTVHDVLDHDGRPWIVMQYVDGPSLADVVKQGEVDFREAARIGLAVLGALGAAHAAGVLHRDVKPGNVLLAGDGRVLLTDFGIAAIEGDSTITRTGELVGSIDYLAPERVRGNDPGPASDLWSLGATLYAAVQGVSPFRRTSPLSTMQAIVGDEPVHPDRAGPLASVIAALLRKNPNARPTVAEGERMLREVLEGAAGGAADRLQTGSAPVVNVLADGDVEEVTTDLAPPPEPTRPSARTGEGSGDGDVGTADLGVRSGAYSGPHSSSHSGSRSGPHSGTQERTSVPPPLSHTHPTAHTYVAGRGPRGHWRKRIAVVVLAAVLGGGVVFAALKYEDGSDTASGSTSSMGVSAGGDSQDSATGGVSGDEVAVSEGWTRIEAEEGFSLNVPQGWERRTDSSHIDYTPDKGRHLLRITIDSPDFETPRLHMLNVEKSLGRLPDYRRISLRDNAFRDHEKSALWEFAWTERTGNPGPRRAIDQIYFSDDSATEYAIFMSGPEDDWAATRKQFDAVLRSWQPPPEESG